MTNKRIKQRTLEAAEWWTTLRDASCTRADKEKFVDWLRASPENIEEYLELASTWYDLNEVTHGVDLEDILIEAKDASNIVSLDLLEDEPEIVRSGQTWGKRKIGRWAAAALILLLPLAMFYWQQSSDEILQTRVGEQRLLSLSDGSVIKLNTNTRLSYHVNDRVREVRLLEGEALFDVAHDESRPFSVYSGSVSVKVHGTTFNIYRQSSGLSSITVLEGSVSVETDTDTGLFGRQEQAWQLAPGDQLRIDSEAGKVTQETVSNPQKVVEWTEGRISFHDETLANVVAEFNRYNIVQIQIEEPELANLRLSGVFQHNGYDALFEFLRRTEDIRVLSSGDRRLISH